MIFDMTKGKKVTVTYWLIIPTKINRIGVTVTTLICCNVSSETFIAVYNMCVCMFCKCFLAPLFSFIILIIK